MPNDTSIEAVSNGAPNPSTWELVKRTEFNCEWTEECQGIAGDGYHWYVTSDRIGQQRIYKLDSETWAVESALDVRCGHLGPPSHHDGYLYVAVEESPQVFGVELASFLSCDVFSFDEEPELKSCPWLAIDPKTGLLYSSIFGGKGGPSVSRVKAYRIDANRRRLARAPESDVLLGVRGEVRRVQGGTITPSGFLVLSCDTMPAALRCFSMQDGREFPEPYAVAKNPHAGEELEGIAFLTSECNGRTADLHLVELDNNWPGRDHAIIKQYAAPDLRK